MELSERQINEIVYKLRIALREDLRKMLSDQKQPEMISTAEAARIVGITPSRLRQIVYEDPQRYPHIKQGTSKQAKLLFDRKALLNL